MAKYLSAVLLAVLLVSCDMLQEFVALESDQFWAIDFTKNADSYYKVTAELLAEGKHCVIWVEKGAGVTRATAEKFAAEYDNNIRPKIAGAFGMTNITKESTAGGAASEYHFDDILDYANWLAGQTNRKLTVLLLDIKDGFKNPEKDSYTAGYFYSGNFGPRDSGNSNGLDMIYVDTYPGLKLAEAETYATFAHELQHLINYATTTLKRARQMDTWIDEGLSSQAEHIYFGKNRESKCKWFIEDKHGTIAKGNNFFVWDNHPEVSMAILDEYATVYMFFRWLYLQAEDKGLQSDIFLDIVTSDLSDYRVITNVAKNINPAWADWDTLLRSWLAANYYPKNTVYGYKRDSYFQNNIKVKPLTNITSISLYPGEGVYSNINSAFTPPATGTYIRYAGLSIGNSSGITTLAPFSSNVLLTFNANTNNSKSAGPETGSLTGVSAGVSLPPDAQMSIEIIKTDPHTGPYLIDARDISGILGRNK